MARMENCMHVLFIFRVINTLMLYKLRNVGVSGIFYNDVKNMYVSSNLCVNRKSGVTQLPFNNRCSLG